MSNENVAKASDLGLDFYQKRAMNTAVFACPDYPLVALGEEVGEVMGKIAKFGRKNDMPVVAVIRFIKEVHMDSKGLELREAVKKEMGDVLWQWAVLCNELGFSAQEVALDNLAKLQDRQGRGVLNGEGDNR